METESSLRNVVFLNKNRTVFLDKSSAMNNVQKHNICADDRIAVQKVSERLGSP
jgi:hypothetical protein